MDEIEAQQAIEKRINSDRNYRQQMQKAVRDDNTGEIIKLIGKVCDVIPIIAGIVAWIMKFFA